jgi:hypothetical protein
MMESTAFFNAKAVTPEISLFLDIDSKTEIINALFYDGPKAFDFKVELDEIRKISIGKSIEELKILNRH